MIRKCPSCRGDNIRRSSMPASEPTWRKRLLSPYRCRDCQTQFWVISRRTYIVSASIVATIVAASIVIFLLGLMLTPGTAPEKRPRRSDGGQPERVLVAVDIRLMPRSESGA